MTLIDSLEHYYTNRDDEGNLRTQDEPQPTENEFDGLEDEIIDDLDEDEEEDEDDVIEDNDPSYARRRDEIEEE